jgi:hypothetical protein
MSCLINSEAIPYFLSGVIVALKHTLNLISISSLYGEVPRLIMEDSLKLI